MCAHIKYLHNTKWNTSLTSKIYFAQQGYSVFAFFQKLLTYKTHIFVD